MDYQDWRTNLLGVAALRIMLLTFISQCVIDFLSIRKVIIFSAIATDDHHPLRSTSIHPNAANCMTIRFRYIAQPRRVRKTYCARSRSDVRRRHSSRSNGMPSKKIMESLRTLVFVETVLRRGRMFRGSDEVKNPLLYHTELKKFGAPDLFTLGRGRRKFFSASSTTMEWLLLKELDFGLLKRTGPSSGVVASIVLVSKGLDCPGMSFVEVCDTCLRCHLW